MEAIVALVGAVALLAGGVLTYRATSRSTDHTRITALEARVDAVEKREHLLWTWNRELVDHIYRGKPPPPPDMPSGLAA